MLWRCTTICTCWGGKPNSHTASISSRPLFISVAESTVILAPMFQLGCRSASRRVTPANSSRFLPKKGPPDAVSSIFCRLFAEYASCRH